MRTIKKIWEEMPADVDIFRQKCLKQLQWLLLENCQGYKNSCS